MEEEDAIAADQENSQQLVEVVKSQVVVKFCNTDPVQQFISLECNTDLNAPPRNWMKTTNTNGFNLHQSIFQKPYFASFHIAQKFPDSAGNVDVVSDAENMKKLLKLAYYKSGVVSMMVHKVGNTLLLDEFDISRFLVRKSAVEWAWLRKFLIKHIITLRQQNKHVIRLEETTREASYVRNLHSKFLYRSLQYTQAQPPKSVPRPMPALPGIQPVLPEPKVTENMQDAQSEHNFNRNVLWTFEDIRMLIGTDMPIFGGPNRPCISLRLRNITEPINVLTGIDYWLDNLMCNVPEVLMCYHLDGIVQKYELIKTEDLPNLENSQFSPQVVRNVAQNILAFLKVNATKAGHTYWLFKGLDDDVVKLYDLTTLCQLDTEMPMPSAQPASAESRENPFTVPVGMLLYSVARNMKTCVKRVSPKRGGAIRALLENCINLLDAQKYAQIVSSSHYMLADLYIPAGINHRQPVFDACEEEDDWDEDYASSGSDSTAEDEENLFQDGVKAATTVGATMKEFDEKAKDFLKAHTKKPAALSATTLERCQSALQHVSAGLACLFKKTEQESAAEVYLMESEENAKEEQKLRIVDEEEGEGEGEDEEEVANANATLLDKTIPLPYDSCLLGDGCSETVQVRQKLRSFFEMLSDKAQLNMKIEQIKKMQRHKQLRMVANFNERQFGSWNMHLRLLLVEKACNTFATLAEHHYAVEQFGSALYAVHMALRCHHVLNKYIKNDGCHQGLLLARAGDCIFQITKNWTLCELHLLEYSNQLKDAQRILEYITADIDKKVDDNVVLLPLNNLEAMMLLSIKYYTLAMDATDPNNEKDVATRNDIIRRLGNAENEAGLKYMFWAQDAHLRFVEVIQSRKQLGLDISQDDPRDLKTVSEYLTLAVSSHFHLKCSINAFEACGDKINLAFLHCNMGRYWRFRAHMIDPKATEPPALVIKQLKELYLRSFKNYEKAFTVLESRKMNPALWDLVNWEVSTANYHLAKKVQDMPLPTQEQTNTESSKLILELLQNALKLCQQNHPDLRNLLYLHRSGLVHKRIAMHHFQHLRTPLNTQQFKTTLALCLSHYDKAAKILEELDKHADLFTIQLDRICVFQTLAEKAHNVAKRIKYLHEALNASFLVPKILQKVLESIDKENEPAESANFFGLANQPESNIKEHLKSAKFLKLLHLFVEVLQLLLKNLLKDRMTGKNSKKVTTVYKDTYMRSLQAGVPPKQEDSVDCNNITEIIQYSKMVIQLSQDIKDMFEKSNE